jgi:hypothetical protein
MQLIAFQSDNPRGNIKDALVFIYYLVLGQATSGQSRLVESVSKSSILGGGGLEFLDNFYEYHLLSRRNRLLILSAAFSRPLPLQCVLLFFFLTPAAPASSCFLAVCCSC